MEDTTTVDAELLGVKRRKAIVGDDKMILARVVCALLAGLSLWVVPTGALAHEGDEEQVPAGTGGSINQVSETPPGADRIIGSPDPGPAPQQSGDRGGPLQFATLGAVSAAVALIMWRVVRATRQATLRERARAMTMRP